MQTLSEIRALPAERGLCPRAPRQKNDPQHVAAARELRDRFLVKANSDPGFLLPQGKYDVSRQLDAAPTELKQTPLLKAT